MAEEIKDEVIEVTEEITDEASNQEQTEVAEKTFTQAELDAIIQKEKAKAKRSAEKEYKAKMDEAEKLRKMNADEKAEYEAKKQAEYIAELEAKINRSGLEKEASKMLSENGIAASDEILALVVKDDAERTQEAVNGFAELVNQLADNKVKEMLKGKTPRKVNPEVMADMVSAKLPKMIKFTPLAYVERELVGQPGSTITVPKWVYSGDAKDIAEGVAIEPDQLTTAKSTMTIKKAGKGIELTDEAVLSGYGDPIGQATQQIALALANKVDNDLIEEAKKATQFVTEAPTTGAALDKALAVFDDEEDANYVALINPADAIDLRADTIKNWLSGSEIGANTVVSGTFGETHGVQIVRTKKVEKGKGFLVKVSPTANDTTDVAKYGAFVINLKRDVAIETDRDILKKTTVITGDEHYGVYLYDPTKVVKFGGA